MSAIAGKFYQDPALLSSFRGWVHAQAFSYLHPMGALQPHKGEEPVTVQAQQTSPCRGGSYHRVEVRATWPRKAASKHQGDSLQTQGEATAPRRPSSAGRLHSHRDHNPDTNRRPLRAVLCPLQPGRWANDLPSPATGRRRGNKILPGFPFAPSPLPSWRPPPRSCPSSYGPFPSCRVLNWLGGSRVRAPAALPACSALRCFSRGAGKGGRKGKSGRRSTQAEEAAGWCAGGRGGLWGGRSSCCRCHCYRRCHIGSLLYGQPLRSRDRSRAAVTTVRSRPRERARARPRLPRWPAERTSRRSAASPPSPALPLAAYPWEHAREGGPTLMCVGPPALTPTVKIRLRKRNLIHPGRLSERILTACCTPPWV